MFWTGQIVYLLISWSVNCLIPSKCLITYRHHHHHLALWLIWICQLLLQQVLHQSNATQQGRWHEEMIVPIHMLSSHTHTQAVQQGIDLTAYLWLAHINVRLALLWSHNCHVHISPFFPRTHIQRVYTQHSQGVNTNSTHRHTFSLFSMARSRQLTHASMPASIHAYIANTKQELSSAHPHTLNTMENKCARDRHQQKTKRWD